MSRSQACVALGLEPSFASAMSALAENSFIARLSLLNPFALEPSALDIIAKLMDGDIRELSRDCAVGAVVDIAQLMKQLVYTDPMPGLIAGGERARAGWPNNNWVGLLVDDKSGACLGGRESQFFLLFSSRTCCC